jgi:tetratricopeptide (TPR) repeat protein
MQTPRFLTTCLLVLIVAGGCKPKENELPPARKASQQPVPAPLSPDSTPLSPDSSRSQNPILSPLSPELLQPSRVVVQHAEPVTKPQVIPAKAAWQHGDYQKAVDLVNQALMESTKADGDTVALHLLAAQIHLSLAEPKRAGKHCHQALQVWGQRTDKDASWRLETALCLAEAAITLDQYADAEKFLADAVSLPGIEPNNSILIRQHNLRCRLAYLKGNSNLADSIADQVSALMAGGTWKGHRYLVEHLTLRALLAGYRGDNKEADDYLMKAEAEALRGRPEEHPLVASVRLRRALSELIMGRFEKADKLVNGAFAALLPRVGEKSPLLVPGYNVRATIAYSLDDLEGVEDNYKQAIGILTENNRQTTSGTAVLLNNLGLLLTSQQRYDEALPLFEQALTIDERVLGANHPNLSSTLNNLAILYDSLDQSKKAEALYRRALDIVRKAHGNEHPDVVTNLMNLATLCTGQERYAEAMAFYQEAIGLGRKVLSPNDPNLGMLHLGLGDIYTLQDQPAQAEQQYRTALDQIAASLGPKHPYTALAHNALGEILDAEERVKEAEEQFQLARKILGQQDEN